MIGPRGDIGRLLAATSLAALLLASGTFAFKTACAEDFRVETRVYVGEAEAPSSTSLTLLRGGVVYNFLFAGGTAPDVFWNVVAPSDMSAPAQNARPAPVTITARTSPSASAASSAATISCTILDVKALSLSGRSSVMVATRSST